MPKLLPYTALLLVLMLTACGEGGCRDTTPGYMEAELVLVGAEIGGRISGVSAVEGGSVESGDMLFTLQSDTQQAAVAAAKGRLDEANAALNLARVSLERAKDLRARGVVAQSRLDDAQSAYDRNLAATAAARAAYDEASSLLAKLTVKAPQSGTVEEVYFRTGEVVNPGQPVVAILPPENLKVRFYVPEARRAALRPGQRVGVTCDGCPQGLSATVSFIAREAEYTPPIIFSREERRKLVYLVEARPEGDTAKLTAGQPVTVELGACPEALGS